LLDRWKKPAMNGCEAKNERLDEQNSGRQAENTPGTRRPSFRREADDHGENPGPERDAGGESGEEAKTTDYAGGNCGRWPGGGAEARSSSNAG
jgi:hypothetical protein